MREIRYLKGFTLIELMVVVAIIAMLAAIILAALTNARNKGVDAAVKTNLKNATGQAEIFYGTNTTVPDTYTNVCINGVVGGAAGIGSFVLAAAYAAGLSSYSINATGTLTTATCNASANAWAAEVPLKTSGSVWCVDSTGKSKQESVTIGAGTACS